MRLVMQTNPVMVFSEDEWKTKKDNFITFAAHQSNWNTNAIVLTELMDNSHAPLLAESLGTQSGRCASDRNQAEVPAPVLRVTLWECGVTVPESFCSESELITWGQLWVNANAISRSI